MDTLKPADTLFPQLAPGGPYPKELLNDSKVAAGLRYVMLGEDDLSILFFGRPHLDDVLTAAAQINHEEDLVEPHELPRSLANVKYVDAVLITKCPHHATREEDTSGKCFTCWATPTQWQVWWTAEAQKSPERFPAAVWVLS